MKNKKISERDRFYELLERANRKAVYFFEDDPIDTKHVLLSFFEEEGYEDFLKKRDLTLGELMTFAKNQPDEISDEGETYSDYLKTIIENLSKDDERSPNNLMLKILDDETCGASKILIHFNIFTGFRNSLKSERVYYLKIPREMKNYATNLTKKIELNSKEKTILGRDKEVSQTFVTLGKCTKSNALLLGDPGVGKTAVVEEIARRIFLKENIQEKFSNYEICSINVNNMVAGTRYRGGAEEKFKFLSNFIVENKDNVIFFIDEIHKLCGAGKSEGSLDLGTALKPILTIEGVKVIGATTWDEYYEELSKDLALVRRFSIIKIDEPEKHKIQEMISKKVERLSEYHDIDTDEETIAFAIKKSAEIEDRFFPDKALDTIDYAMSFAALVGEATLNFDHILEAINTSEREKELEPSPLS